MSVTVIIGRREYLAPAIFFCKLIRYTVHMKTISKSTTPKSSKKTSVWEKAAGLLKSKKAVVLRELSQSRKTWSTKHK